MKKKLSIFLILSILVPQSTFALSFANVPPVNLNNIITDDQLQDWSSMTKSDIQNFLDSQNGYLKSYYDDNVSGTRKIASEIIHDAARRYSINPKYLLVKLQKEQSLITDPDPTQYQLDWATGYAVCDSCKTTDPALQKNRGFGRQVDSAAGIMRWYYENINNPEYSWIKKGGQSFLIDNTLITPANNATAFLYNYTPHTHGNTNFWKLWQTWFGQVYPDGTLMKSVDSPDVYLINDKQKRKIATVSALLTRFDPKFILTVPAAELSRYDTGSDISLPNWSILKAGSDYYLLDYDTLRPFENADTFRKFGYNPGEVVEIEPSEVSNYKLGDPITEDELGEQTGRLVKLSNNPAVYYLYKGKYNYVTNMQVLEINFPHLSIETISQSEFDKYQMGKAVKLKDGILVKVKDSSKIYVIEHGERREIPKENFSKLGYREDNIIEIDQMTALQHPVGEPLYIQQVIAETTVSVADSVPDSVVEEDIMIRTPLEETVYAGDKFATEVNTYLVADYDTGKILAAKNHQDIRPMASFAKIMTAYELALEGLRETQVSVYDPEDHKSPLFHRFRTEAGEKFRASQLLDSLLVSSLNTPARMLVDLVDEDESKFIDRMNERVISWGLENTAFADVAGVRLGTKTTAEDYLTIFTKATKNSMVRKYSEKTDYEYTELLDKDGKPDHFDEHSNHLMKESDLDFKILSSKTGYLDEAGSGLAMLVERLSDDKQFVIITMGNPNYTKRFDAPRELTEWALKRF